MEKELTGHQPEEHADWEHYSARQDVKMKLGRFVGEVQYEGEVSEFVAMAVNGQAIFRIEPLR